MDLYLNTNSNAHQNSENIHDSPSVSTPTMGHSDHLTYDPAAYPTSTLLNFNSTSPTLSNSAPMMSSTMFPEAIHSFPYSSNPSSHFVPHESYPSNGIYNPLPPSSLSNMNSDVPMVNFSKTLLSDSLNTTPSDTFNQHVHYAQPSGSQFHPSPYLNPSPPLYKFHPENAYSTTPKKNKRQLLESPSDLTLKNVLRQFWQDQFQKINDPNLDLKSHAMPLARVKKVIKSDPGFRISMIASEVPILLSKLSEIFISEFILRAWVIADDLKRRTIQGSDVISAGRQHAKYDFLVDILHQTNKIPDPEESQDSIFNDYIHTSPRSEPTPNPKTTKESNQAMYVPHLNSSIHPTYSYQSPPTQLFSNFHEPPTLQPQHTSPNSSVSRKPFYNYSNSTFSPPSPIFSSSHPPKTHSESVNSETSYTPPN
ncbi:hypothetical protein HMI54_014878 [Coelomomyces lativittatus]|nr:hypothetical protein HMI54_014878 [Coelomomyces lativittatus]KAJ1515385.1 hypothetical protein HMI56_005226 [Coelomomyces lativittatus]KAJ1517513.1 hypothetical protein HMI55_006866 [Coelomomyces lativittatus]